MSARLRVVKESRCILAYRVAEHGSLLIGIVSRSYVVLSVSSEVVCEYQDHGLLSERVPAQIFFALAQT